jgi:predicted phage terminase large subunit-like protein
MITAPRITMALVKRGAIEVDAETRERLRVIRERKRAGIRAVPDSLIEYAKTTAPDWDWTAQHLVWIAERLTRWQPGMRLCLEVPIRHGKSELATIRFAAWRIIRNPKTRVLIGCNADKLAQKFSRAIRRLVRLAGVTLNPERDTAGEWETTQGGGVRAVGMGGATAGYGADVLIVDDPIANRAQAESDIERDRVWEAFTSDLLSRLEPDGIAILTMSRWHEDDPTGRLKEGRAGDEWEFIRFPGIAEAGDPLGRAEGDALWPARWPVEKLEERRLILGAIAFAGLIQQSPQPKGGSMFQWGWWQLLDVVPATTGPVVRYWDIAGTEPKKGKNDPDYTVGVLMGRMADQRFVVLDVCRIRASIGQRDAAIRAQMLEDVQAYGSRLRYWIERPTGMGGEDQATALRQALAGIVVSFETPTTDKATRAAPLASHAEGGLVCLAPGPWRDPFRLEFSAFPRGKHDDQVDATSGSFAKIALTLPTKVTQTTFTR